MRVTVAVESSLVRLSRRSSKEKRCSRGTGKICGYFQVIIGVFRVV